MQSAGRHGWYLRSKVPSRKFLIQIAPDISVTGFSIRYSATFLHQSGIQGSGKETLTRYQFL